MKSVSKTTSYATYTIMLLHPGLFISILDSLQEIQYILYL